MHNPNRLHPYAPTTETVVSPYAIVSSEVQERLTTPAIGLDGGILLPQAVISRESHMNSLLGRYLANRTMPTGELYAVTHGENEEIVPHSAKQGEWYTSRRMATYYGINYGAGPADKSVRKQRLMANLDQDALLIANWTTIERSIHQYAPETQWRIYTALFQNFTNDWAGLNYAYNVAASYSDIKDEDVAMISDATFAGAKTYYDLLLHPERIEKGVNVMPLLLLTNAGKLLEDMPDETTADTIRTRSETDHSFLTLAAAQTLMNEFSDEVVPPTILVPQLGGYHLIPALQALGYTGPIETIIPVHKHLTPSGKRADIDQALPSDLQERLAGQKVVIFEDTIGTGRHLITLTEQLHVIGIDPIAIRTMFVGDRIYEDNELPPHLKDIFSAYYSAPTGRKLDRSNSMGGSIQKRTTRRWAEQSETY